MWLSQAHSPWDTERKNSHHRRITTSLQRHYEQQSTNLNSSLFNYRVIQCSPRKELSSLSWNLPFGGSWPKSGHADGCRSCGWWVFVAQRTFFRQKWRGNHKTGPALTSKFWVDKFLPDLLPCSMYDSGAKFRWLIVRYHPHSFGAGGREPTDILAKNVSSLVLGLG